MYPLWLRLSSSAQHRSPSDNPLATVRRLWAALVTRTTPVRTTFLTLLHYPIRLAYVEHFTVDVPSVMRWSPFATAGLLAAGGVEAWVLVADGGGAYVGCRISSGEAVEGA